MLLATSARELAHVTVEQLPVRAPGAAFRGHPGGRLECFNRIEEKLAQGNPARLGIEVEQCDEWARFQFIRFIQMLKSPPQVIIER